MTFRSFVLLAGVLACAVALAGFIIGWRVATLTESDVIEAAAARYVADHKGAPEHCEALAKSGPCAHHRRSFAPVRDALTADLFR